MDEVKSMKKNFEEPDVQKQLKERSREIRILNIFSDIIVKNISDKVTIMNKALDYAMRLVGFESGIISEVDFDSKKVVGKRYRGIERNLFNEINKISSKSLSKLLKILLKKEITHFQNFSDIDIPCIEDLKQQGFTDFIIAIANMGGIPYAVIFMCSRNKHLIETDKLRVLKAFSRQLGTALAHCNANRELLESKNSLRTANQLWENTFDAIQDVVLITDREGKIIRSNRASFNILGIAQDKIIGRNIFEYVHRWCSKCEEIFPKVLSSGKSYDFEVKIPTSEKFLIIAINPIYRGENISGTLLVIHDITEKRQIWEQLAQTQKLESIGFLASGVAHNFNNILMTITGNLYQLESELGELHRGEIAETIISMQRAIDDATDTIRQLLSFSRIHSEERNKFDPGEFLNEFDFLRKAFPANVNISIDSNSDNCWILGDSQKLKQALMNLIINAKDAMPDGGNISVEINKKKFSGGNEHNLKPGEYVVITVQDEGIGIPHENIPKIFDPFFTTKESDKGTGLGLSLVYNSIKAMDGKIEVHSQEEQGTIFMIFLPAVSPPRISTGKERIQFPAKLLLVEDDRTLNNLFETFLGRQGYEVKSAISASEALKSIGAVKPDVAIIDTYLPDSSDENFLWAVAKKCPKTPIVVISGSNPDPAIIKLLDNGRGAFLLKPFKLIELDETIQILLEKKMKSPRWN
ncbi:response regulator [bacterium]|nr:response regulator [bacterium]